MRLSVIVNMSANRVIGNKGQLPKDLPSDLAYFKSITIGRPVIMGRKTHESIGCVLPNRLNVVITSKEDFKVVGDNIITFTSLHNALKFLEQCEEDEVFVIGGAIVYREALTKFRVDRLYITQARGKEIKGDCYFPVVNMLPYKLVSDKAEKYSTYQVWDRI